MSRDTARRDTLWERVSDRRATPDMQDNHCYIHFVTPLPEEQIAETLLDTVRAGRVHPANAFSDALGQLHKLYGRKFTSEGHDQIRGAQDALEHVAENDRG